MRIILYSLLFIVFLCCKHDKSELPKDVSDFDINSFATSNGLDRPPPSYYLGCTFIEVEDQLFFHDREYHYHGDATDPPFIELTNKDLILLDGQQFNTVIDSLLNNKKESRFKICELVNSKNRFSKRNFEKLKTNLPLESGFVWYRRPTTLEEIGVLCRRGAEISGLCNFKYKYRRFSLRKDNASSYYKYSYPAILFDSIYNIPLSAFEDVDPFYFHLNLKNRELDSTHRFLSKRNFKVNNKEFEVYKFTNAYNDPPMDGVGNYFFSPQIGMLVLYSVNWGSFEKLIDCPKINQEELDYLTFQILSDSIFLRFF